MGLFDFLFGGSSRESYRILDIDNLGSRDGLVFCWKKYSHRPQKRREELSNEVNGRKVKFWLWYYGADVADGDKFVPIYYGEHVPRKRIKSKRIFWKKQYKLHRSHHRQ